MFSTTNRQGASGREQPLLTGVQEADVLTLAPNNTFISYH